MYSISYNGARMTILNKHGYAIGLEHNCQVWYAPYNVATPLSLDEAWTHYILSVADEIREEHQGHPVSEDKYPTDKLLLTQQLNPAMNGVWVRASKVRELEAEIERLKALLKESVGSRK